MSGDMVFILSDVGSGSTLVDQLLGANDDVVTLGEVHWLAAYLTRDRRIYNPAHPLDSLMNRGKTLEAAALGWKNTILQMEELKKDVNPDSVFRLKYEDFCLQPKLQSEKLCAFLDLKYSDGMLVRRTEALHHIGGSASEFDVTKSEIKLDTNYVKFFAPSELIRLQQILGDSARIWGY